MNAYKLVGWHVVVHRQPTINLKEFCDPAREILLVLCMTNKVHYDFQYQYDSGSGSVKDEGTRNMPGIVIVPVRCRQIGNKIFQQRTPWVLSIFPSRGQSIQLIVPFYGLNEKNRTKCSNKKH